jgi:hypothetical protein
MIHDPLLDIAKLKLQNRKLTEKEWDSIWSDMNCAVCFFLRLQEHNCMPKHLDEQIKLFLNSRYATKDIY